MQIEREARKARQVPLTPLIDVVFLLLVFFMLSSSFVRSESLELMLPQANGGGSADEGRLLQVYVARDGSTYIGRRLVNEEGLIKTLRGTIEKFPDVGVLLLSGPRVSVQQMVTVMDNIYQAGSTNLSVASWEPERIDQAPAAPIDEVTPEMEPAMAEEVIDGN
ncbi:MAG: biopolymer transporter ExbD [Rickettsiales bacterium]|nr:biopolymer transporter ExbD [Rickettsiales bacterium]